MSQRATHFRRLQRGLGWLAFLAAAVLALPACAHGQHPRRNDQYKHQVEKLEEVWRAAQLSGDVAAMDQLLSDDYVGITMSGQVVTKMQQLDRMRNRTMMLSKMQLSDVKVKIIGSTATGDVAAIVLSLAQAEGTIDGQPIHGTFRATRVYSRLPNGTWKITNFEATRVGPPPMRGEGPPDGDRRPGDGGHGSQDEGPTPQ